MKQVATALGSVMERAKDLAEQGALHIDPDVVDQDIASLIAKGLRYFSTYHRDGVLKRRGDRLFAQDMNLVFYYHNRLVGYGLEKAIDAQPGEESR